MARCSCGRPHHRSHDRPRCTTRPPGPGPPPGTWPGRARTTNRSRCCGRHGARDWDGRRRCRSLRRAVRPGHRVLDHHRVHAPGARRCPGHAAARRHRPRGGWPIAETRPSCTSLPACRRQPGCQPARLRRPARLHQAPGSPLARWARLAMATPRCGSLMAGCSSLGGSSEREYDMTSPSCTTRRAGPGPPPGTCSSPTPCFAATLLRDGRVLVGDDDDPDGDDPEHRRGGVRPSQRDLDRHRKDGLQEGMLPDRHASRRRQSARCMGREGNANCSTRTAGPGRRPGR